MKLAKSRALITGASQGLGLALKQELIKRGCAVSTVSRSRSDYALDLTKLDDVKALIKIIQTEDIDLLILNAGKGMSKTFEHYDLTFIMEMNMLNGLSHALVLQGVWPLILSGKLKVALTTSIAGKLPSPLMAPYSASKAYASNLVDSLNAELHGRGVTHNYILDISPGHINTKDANAALTNFSALVCEALMNNQRYVYNDPIYAEVLRRPAKNWEAFVLDSYERKLARIEAKRLHYVFDYDQTIAQHNELSKVNQSALDQIRLKVLNTSKSYAELPKVVKQTFDKIMTLNGSLYYESGVIKQTFKTLSNLEVSAIIDLAKQNHYNIAFNNTTSDFQNVKGAASIAFMEANGIKHRPDIVIPASVYQVVLSHATAVGDEVLKLPCQVFRLGLRSVELSANDKGNIKQLFPSYVAFGDSANDTPMFAKALHFYVIGKDITFSDDWIKDAINQGKIIIADELD